MKDKWATSSLTYAATNLLHGRQGPSGSEALLRDSQSGDVLFWNRSTGSTMGAAQVYPRGAGLSRGFGQASAGVAADRQYHLNEHGNVIATSDASQNTETSFQYDAFGNVLSGSATNNSYDYAGDSGYWRDLDTGLMYVQQRW